MGEHDGSVILDIELSAAEIDQELSRLKQKALRLEEELSFKTLQADKAAAKLRLLREELAEIYKNAPRNSFGAPILGPDVLPRVTAIKKEIRAAEKEQSNLIAKIQDTESALGAVQQRYSTMAQEAVGTTEKTGNALGKFTNRIKSMALRLLIFAAIGAALRAFRDHLKNAILVNKDARASIAQLKGALLTLAQPLLSVVIPAFTAFVKVLTQVVTALATVIAAIMGTTVESSAAAAESLQEEEKALGGVGAAAKKAGKSLAAFDEINKLDGGDTGAAGGGGAASSEIAPDFSFLDGASERLQEIAKWVTLIGLGFAAWKIGGKLGGALGALLQKLGALLVLLGSVILFIKGFADAWENGVDWLNLIAMIGGLAGAIWALYTLLGPTAAAIAAVVGGLALFVVGFKDAFENGVSWPNAIAMVAGLAAVFAGLWKLLGSTAASIAAVVGGIAMLVLAFRDAMKNGWNLQNTFLAIAGILAAGLGIGVLVDSWIPLLIAGIAAVLLAITVATGHGEELLEGIKTMLGGFLDFFTGIFTGDMEKAVGGINKIFEGLGMVVHAVINGVRDLILGFLDFLDEQTGGKLHGIIEFIKALVNGAFEMIGGVVDGLVQILRGVLTFLTGVFTADWELAWKGVQDVFGGIFNAIAGVFGGVVNLIIRGLNFVISKINGLSFDVPDWVPGIGGTKFGFNIPLLREWEVPKLAKGAVIPPNREFMAVLGDQSSGTNIETPEALLRQIVREENGQYLGILQQILSAIKEGRIMVVDEYVFARVVNESNTRETSRQGQPMVTLW